MPDSKKPGHHVPGTTQIHFQARADLHRTMKAIQKARCRYDGTTPSLSQLFIEAVELYVRSTNLETGHLSPVHAIGSDGPGILVPPDLPRFGQFVNCDKFTDDAELFAEMDRSAMLVWAANPASENLHVSSLLAKFAGRPACDFRQFGWAVSLHPDDREQVIRECVARFETRQYFRFTYRFKRHDGLYGQIIDAAQPRYRPDGTFAGYVGTMYQFGHPGSEVRVMAHDGSDWRLQARGILPA
jgi:PAS domain-containing protein